MKNRTISCLHQPICMHVVDGIASIDNFKNDCQPYFPSFQKAWRLDDSLFKTVHPSLILYESAVISCGHFPTAFLMGDTDEQ